MKVLIGLLKFVSYYSLWGVAICGLYFAQAVFLLKLSAVINDVIYGLLLYGLHRFTDWTLTRLSPKAVP